MTAVTDAITGLPPAEPGHGGVSPIRFVLVFVLLYAATALVPEQVLAPVNRLFAYGSANLLEAWGLPTLLQGDILIAGGFHARVIDECTPLFMVIMFASFLAAYPAGLQRKGKALLLATLFFSCLTVLRIAFLVFVGANYPAQFQFVHAYLAQSLMVLAVILAAVVWSHGERAGVSDLPILGFFSRFILWSSFLFFAWLPLNKIYMQQLDHLLVALFSLADRQLLIPHGHTLYFQTFNLVTFGGLMLASRASDEQHDRRHLFAGLVLLVFGHLLVRFGNIMATAFNVSWGFPFATSISIASQYLAPFLLWWIMVMNRNKKEQTV